MQKCYVIVFNGIFLALGLMLLIFGLWLLFDRSNFFTVLFSSGKNQLVPYISCILLGIGSAITFTSALGFLGSVLEIKRLLVTETFFEQSGLDYMKAEAETILLIHLLSTTNITWHSSERSPGAITWNLVHFRLPWKYLVPQYQDTYMSFQILVFVTQMAILVLIFVKKEEVHNQWNNRIDEVVSEYGNESLAEQEPVWNILNAMQHKMECCGRYNVTQWERNKNKENSTQIPCSCTKSGLKKWFCDVSRDSTYSVGCEEHLRTWFENNVLILTAVSISLLITQILLITSTGQLLRNIRKNNIWPNES